MGLFVDIEGNDKFAKQALATAAALDKIAQSEKQVNALAQKLGVTTKAVAAASKHMAAEKAAAEKKMKQDEQDRKQREADFRDKIKAGAAAWYLFKDAVAMAKDTVVDLAKTILESSFNASQAKREATAMIGAFTNGRAPEFMKALDKLAGNLGQTAAETRAQFVAFREAGMNNDMSFRLIKARADMIALGISAKTADQQIGYITSAGRDMGLAFAKLRDVETHIKGVGGGATAAAYAVTSLSAAQAKVETAVTEKLAALWDKVAPDIGRAAHRLADFVTEMVNSKEGQAIFEGIADKIKALTGSIDKDAMAKMFSKETLDHAWTTIKDVAAAAADIAHSFAQIGNLAGQVSDAFGGIGKVARGVSAMFGGKIGEGVAQYVEAQDAITANAAALNAKKAELAGGDIGAGLARGMADSMGAVGEQAQSLADQALSETARKLEIHSPSRAFARLGKQTVAGFNEGQEEGLARPSPFAERMNVGSLAPSAGGDTRNTNTASIVIEQLIVQGGGTGEDNARSIRQELQLLLTAQQLSRGLAGG